ncbi:P-loop containing nucleoside triphosphate hydrolase protein, partial [Russula dissimulans]
MRTRQRRHNFTGPPGTGKTTTIAAAAGIWSSHGTPCWIIAQSNVGVKNIAETLAKKKVNFKLLVSQEFLFEWHEELYVGLEDKMIRSDELPDSKEAVARAFDDATVVLCTLSMLSNPKLYDCGLFEVVPLKSLVIDEASQIDVFQLMHLFYKFANVLTKVCFFGDPKQQKVYDRKLQSRHEIVDHSCLAFINVAKGEEMNRGNSYQNMEEVHMVVRVAKRYKQHHLNFCVITFYDPQRAAIMRAFEDADMSTGCVFNVDSFQGNEADYVILSSVRTEHAGFLKSQPRMNVALTRCRKGLVVVTHRAFLLGLGKNTLLGQLCTAWSSHRGNDVWIDWKDMLN